jgi:hypothetical protein
MDETRVIQKRLLFRELDTSTDSDIFDTANSYFQDGNIYWNNCTSVCTDFAATMTGAIHRIPKEK